MGSASSEARYHDTTLRGDNGRQLPPGFGIKYDKNPMMKPLANTHSDLGPPVSMTSRETVPSPTFTLLISAAPHSPSKPTPTPQPPTSLAKG